MNYKTYYTKELAILLQLTDNMLIDFNKCDNLESGYKIYQNNASNEFIIYTDHKFYKKVFDDNDYWAVYNSLPKDSLIVHNLIVKLDPDFGDKIVFEISYKNYNEVDFAVEDVPLLEQYKGIRIIPKDIDTIIEEKKGC